MNKNLNKLDLTFYSYNMLLFYHIFKDNNLSK